MNQIAAIFSECIRAPTVDTQVFQQILREVGPALSDVHMEDMLRSSDALQGGHVDLGRFLRWLYDDQEAQLPTEGVQLPPPHARASTDQSLVARAPTQQEVSEYLEFMDADAGIVRYNLNGAQLAKQKLGHTLLLTTLEVDTNSSSGCKVKDNHGQSEILPIWHLETLGVFASKAGVVHNIPKVPPIKKAYIVSMSDRGCQTGEGITWQHSPELPDRIAFWGSVLYGTPFLDWIKIEGYYLPMSVDGENVLQPQDPPCAANHKDLCADAGCIIPLTEERGITVRQLQAIAEHIESCCDVQGWIDHNPTSPFHGQRLEHANLNLYQALNWIIMPATHKRQCSYVEFVANASQRPRWFASHWWGEPVLDFASCVNSHAKLRHISADTAYWVCAYANCQWDLGGEIVDDPAQTSFRKAMQIAEGTLSIVDKGGVTYTRIWCDYEVAMTLRAQSAKLYDIATCTGVNAVVITDGPAIEDRVQGMSRAWSYRGGTYAHKMARESSFPLHLISKALTIRLECGNASFSIDRARILNSIAERDLALPPLEAHPNYDNLNVALHWRLGMAMMQVIAETDAVDELGLWNLPEPVGWPIRETYHALSSVFIDQAKYEAAAELLKRIRRIMEATGSLESPSGAFLLMNMGLVCFRRGDLDGAMQAYQNSRRIREATGSLESPDGAGLLMNMGSVCNQRGDLDGAMQAYQNSRRIREATGSLESPQGALLLMNMGLVCSGRGDLDGAMQAYQNSRRIMEATGSLESPDGAGLLMNMGSVCNRRGDLDGAMQAYQNSRRIMEATGSLESPDGAGLLMNMGLVCDQRGDLDGAMQAYQNSRRIMEATGSLESPDGAALLANMGSVCDQRGDLDGAMQATEQLVHQGSHWQLGEPS